MRNNKKRQQPIPKTKKNKRAKFAAIFLILVISATTGFAFPVYDAANHAAQFQVLTMQEQSQSGRFTIQEQNRYAEFIETMNRWATQFRNWKEQFDHARQVWKEVDQMRGNWRGVFQRLADQEFVRAVLGDEGRDLIRLGWELRNPNHTNIETLPDEALDALERIEKIMTKKNQRGGNLLNQNDPTLRDDLQEIYGAVPGTRPDIENAHRTIARATSSIGDINRAIDERRQNIEMWKSRIAAGGLVPGDLERLQIMISAEQQDIQLLNSRLQALNIEVQMAQTGVLVAEGSYRESSRIKAESDAAKFADGAGLINPIANTDGNTPPLRRRNNRY